MIHSGSEGTSSAAGRRSYTWLSLKDVAWQDGFPKQMVVLFKVKLPAVWSLAIPLTYNKLKKKYVGGK